MNIGVRIPNNICALSLLKGCKYLTGTSANKSGEQACKSACEVLSSSLRGFNVLLDGGTVEGKIQSTIVDLTGHHPKIIREGAIISEAIYTTWREIVEFINMNFNLIVSTFRHREEEAYNEILDILGSAGDLEAQAEVSDIIGIILGFTRIDLFQVIQIFRKLMIDNPWEIRYILRLLPIETVGPTQLEYITSNAKRLALKINKHETFRITVEKRHTSLSSLDVIKAVAGSIDNKVNLEKPDWIVLVEIVGKLTGVSVLRPNQIFHSVVEKRKISTS